MEFLDNPFEHCVKRLAWGLGMLDYCKSEKLVEEEQSVTLRKMLFGTDEDRELAISILILRLDF